MGKLKKAVLYAIIGSAMLATPALAYNAPEYSLEGAKKKVEYFVLVSGSFYPIKSPSEVPMELKEYPILTITKYGIDINKDYNIDLVEENIICNYKNMSTKKCTNLYVDDDFDGYTDRILSNKKNGDYGTEVKISDIKIEDYF